MIRESYVRINGEILRPVLYNYNIKECISIGVNSYIGALSHHISKVKDIKVILKMKVMR